MTTPLPADLPFQHTLNAQGLRCPLPLLRCKKSLSTLAHGEVLKMTATDQGARVDIPAFCQKTGHILQAMYEENGVWVFFIQKQQTTAGVGREKS